MERAKITLGVERPSTAYQARLYKVAFAEAAKRDYGYED